MSLLLSLISKLLFVQGALITAGSNDLAGHPPCGTRRASCRSTGRASGSARCSAHHSFTGLGIVAGLILLIVPGLIAIARWSLIVPLIVIERRGWREAFARSNHLVTGHTGHVLVLVLIANVITGVVSLAYRRCSHSFRTSSPRGSAAPSPAR